MGPRPSPTGLCPDRAARRRGVPVEGRDVATAPRPTVSAASSPSSKELSAAASVVLPTPTSPERDEFASGLAYASPRPRLHEPVEGVCFYEVAAPPERSEVTALAQYVAAPRAAGSSGRRSSGPGTALRPPAVDSGIHRDHGEPCGASCGRAEGLAGDRCLEHLPGDRRGVCRHRVPGDRVIGGDQDESAAGLVDCVWAVLFGPVPRATRRCNARSRAPASPRE